MDAARAVEDARSTLAAPPAAVLMLLLLLLIRILGRKSSSVHARRALHMDGHRMARRDAFMMASGQRGKGLPSVGFSVLVRAPRGGADNEASVRECRRGDRARTTDDSEMKCRASLPSASWVGAMVMVRSRVVRCISVHSSDDHPRRASRGVLGAKR